MRFYKMELFGLNSQIRNSNSFAINYTCFTMVKTYIKSDIGADPSGCVLLTIRIQVNK